MTQTRRRHLFYLTAPADLAQESCETMGACQKVIKTWEGTRGMMWDGTQHTSSVALLARPISDVVSIVFLAEADLKFPLLERTG